MTDASPPTDSYDVAVIGAGPAGLAAAIALALACPGPAQPRIALLGPAPRPPEAPETRTTALFGPSLALFDRMGVLADLQSVCAPIQAIRLIDDTGRLLRAPETTFHARDVDRAQLGLNVPNSTLVAVLEGALARFPALTRIATAAVTAANLTADGACCQLSLAEGCEIVARLVVAADGRRSIAREAAGIEVESWDYDQTAITATFTHGRGHDSISTELHRPNGPLTTVPLPGNASSLVWVERPAIAARLLGLDDAAFRQALAHHIAGLLGPVGEISPRRAFPLTGLMPKSFGRARVALVGEAAHVFPPIGAQGLNLGLRDGADLAGRVGSALASRGDPGAETVLAAYHASRRLDVATRTYGVDLLGRTLTSRFPPLGLARGLGLHLARSVPAVRRAMIEAGLHSAGPMPDLMREPDLAAARLPS